jgi:hypothetical protein
MEPTSPWSSERLYSNTNEQDGTQKRPTVGLSPGSSKIYKDKDFIAALDTIETAKVRIEVVPMDTSNSSPAKEITEDKLANIDANQQERTDRSEVQSKEAEDVNQLEQEQASKTAVPETPVPEELIQTLNSQTESMPIDIYDTGKIVTTTTPPSPPLVSSFSPPPVGIKRGTAILLIALLAIVALQGLTIGPTQFLGAQGWASVLGNPVTQGNPNLLTNLKKQITTRPVKPGATATVKVQMTPDQYIDLIVNKMTLDQKLGQMMIVQFTGATYSLPISTMISQYNVGAVLVFTANGNVVDKGQLQV